MKKNLITLTLLSIPFFVFAQINDVSDSKALAEYIGAPVEQVSADIILSVTFSGKELLAYSKLKGRQIFGSEPEEILIESTDNTITNLQINYDIAHGGADPYQLTLAIVKEFTEDLGKPSVMWKNDSMEFGWNQGNRILTINHIDLKELQKVIIRVSLSMRQLG